MEWWKEIIEKLKFENKYLYDVEISFIDIKTIIPWENFNYPNNPNANSPAWWRTYNDVKHNRTEIDKDTHKEFFTQANLQNVISAFAGLYVLEKSYIKSIATEEELKLIQKSKLFEKEERYVFTFDTGTLNIDEKKITK